LLKQIGGIQKIKSMEYPLKNIKVLDFTIAMAGPLATQRLGDMGAEVIKVESFNGDLTRIFALSDVWLEKDTTSYLALNRNKKSLVVDLKKKEGLEIIHKLIENVDVVIQNFRPGVVERLGIAFDDLKKINPKIIYASISGYGDEGPLVDAPGQDLLIQGFSGMTFSGGIEEGPPHPAPTYVIDTCASHLATTAILAALVQRSQTGEGQHVKTNLLSAAMEAQSQEIMTYLKSREIAQRSPAPYASAWLEPPYGIYKTKDGWIALPQNDMNVVAQTVDSPELAEVVKQKPAFNDKDELSHWKASMHELLSESLLARNTDDWIKLMTGKKIWCGAVQTIKELLEHPQSQYYVEKFDHPRHGLVDCVAPAMTFSSMEKAPLDPPPDLGEHTHEILESLGYSKANIQTLTDNEVVR
jgi:crotonobetainyl-CoA:carnitine CoA-transferase CaiB-like acyl-CoA transferase